MDQIIIRPIITEKSMDNAGAGRYTFEVKLGANKHEIKTAVERQFKVTVIAVRTMILPGKLKKAVKRKGQRQSQHSSWKKAIVALAPGQKIDLFEGGKE